MLKQGLTLQIMSWKDQCQSEKNKIIGLMKDELGGKIVKKISRIKSENATI